MIDAVHVIACNRDRWQLQRQMQLFADCAIYAEDPHYNQTYTTHHH